MVRRESIQIRHRSNLDPDFTPLSLLFLQYDEALKSASKRSKVGIALERQNGLVSRDDFDVPAVEDASQDASREAVVSLLERHIKFLLWARGGFKLYLSGPDDYLNPISTRLRPFDSEFMSKIYGKPFEVIRLKEGAIPGKKESAARIGGHLNGCRIGFDLGASDYKIAAVENGTCLFSREIPWAPVTQSDPQYHIAHIMEGLREAASHLPRVDAIGGSSAGVYVDNEVRAASLFRSVPAGLFQKFVRPMFLNIQKEWGVPLVIVNDGDVTALAGAMSLAKNAILGIAMGSSEATGYIDGAGQITGCLNELAFAPIDGNPAAAPDEWSGDRGVGALYFSQQAVAKLASRAGIQFKKEMPLPERLKAIQQQAESGSDAARFIFDTIGIYLGYGIPFYARYYDFANLLILGRVTSGIGGEIIVNKARRVLRDEFPALYETASLHVPSEKNRRVGQAVAAASLPYCEDKI